MKRSDRACGVRLRGETFERENKSVPILCLLREEGRVVTVEFVVNADRVAPPQAAAFTLPMLVMTPAGDAYTGVELEGMFREAGFPHSEIHPLEESFQHAIISYL